MKADIIQAQETIRRCRELRETGMIEAVLRAEFLSRLRSIFPSSTDQGWINQYSTGTEAHTIIKKVDDRTANRFIDHLIGSTTIEYEADLRIETKYNMGFSQVKEHAAGLIREGVPASQVRGILSDTVGWYAYDCELTTGVEPNACTVNDITLALIEHLDLKMDDETHAQQLIAFVRKHLAREKSRPLKADFLTLDLGLESSSYQRSAAHIVNLVSNGRAHDPSIALATDLWSKFVDYLERDSGEFRADAYTDEVYLCILARLLSANVLADQAILSDDKEIMEILDGSYFQAHYQLRNMVELDYFGWLSTPQHIGQLVPIAREIQRDLYAYDFRSRLEEDLFGRLMPQLARRSQRKLLGQEWTPSWLARLLAERCLDNLPEGETPKIIDMCCGSGSILTEIIKAAKSKFGLKDISELYEVATGFDIDPLAVTLSKTTWVATLASEIKASTAPIIIPVFHADSLFAVTPVSASLPSPEKDDEFEVSLDGFIVKLPNALVQPSYQELFDRIVDWAYDEACDARTKGHVPTISEQDIEAFLINTSSALATPIPRELKNSLVASVHSLVLRMAELSLSKRNGIWAFILRNTYRPGLLSGQFNGLVSNPPWLAMSGLADNPYREILTARAKLYGICPSGHSFLHLELGTVHLIHAVDRYLERDASIACLVPGTIFNGDHHENFRRHKFLISNRPVAFETREVWQIAPGTFKYPGAAIIGRKRKTVAEVNTSSLRAFHANQHDGTFPVDTSIHVIGKKRTAWVLDKGTGSASTTGMKGIPQQGADLMPRTAICVEIVNNTGVEYRVETPKSGSKWYFTVKAAKEMKGERFFGNVAPRFIFRMAQSENLLPFILGEYCSSIALPVKRDNYGVWHIYDEADIRRIGFTETARHFRTINDKLKAVGKGKTIQQRIDERGKLIKQVFGLSGYLLLAGAGGKHICSTCIPVSDANDLVVDQTLYWKVIQSEPEAWFFVGMLNSHAMTEAISPFNPKGAFGERHIHALPYRLMPIFNPSNKNHQRIAELAHQISNLAQTLIMADVHLGNPNRSLTSRRTKLRNKLSELERVQELELLCASELATSNPNEYASTSAD